jgi:Tol biopolymer transport system component
LLLGLALLPLTLHAQYFGRNRVQYGRFDFKIIQTEHFDVYYYDQERTAALDIARMAERSYARLSRVLAHEFEERKPIILYASHDDFEQTNLGGVDEGTGGFTDYLRHRNTFPMTGSYQDNQHVLTHEMVHQFQFDIWSRGRGGAGVQGIISAAAPLWFGEGMAEYFSLGPYDSKTAMWLRDAALEGKLPSANDFLRVFPYQFGHALVAYIGSRWGDEAVGAITKNASGGGLDNSLRRVLGMNFAQLVAQWQDAVQKQYLPEIGNRVKARSMSKPTLTEKLSGGTWHLAPAMSPDGSKIAYFSERNFYFIDMWLGEVATGKVLHRLFKPSYSSNYETYRYLSSSAAFSEDGTMLTFAAKKGGKDDLLIIDPNKNKDLKALSVPLSGVQTPTFSPDGKKIVFSGLDGGISDLFTVNLDGTELRRLTNDKYADLHPVWSPDGKTIAFVTDRGPETDFNNLRWGNLKIALYHLDTDKIEILPGMDEGRNSSPQWSPDGRSIAFVSDRDNVANIFLYSLDDQQVYQLTDFYTGVQGVTPLSPVLSWARKADRIAFVYFEQGKFDIYTLDKPESLKKSPWKSTSGKAPVLVQAEHVRFNAPTARADSDTTNRSRQVLSSSSIYRGPRGFRKTDSLPPIPDSLKTPPPVTIAKMLDSVNIPLPDTTDFVFRPYKAKFEPEYVARPTIGYTRDNFGRGLTGSATLVLGDMLSNQQLVFGASLNGRLPETQVLAQYVNLSGRLNWAISAQQMPYFFYDTQSIQDHTPSTNEATLVTGIRRLVFRNVSAIGYYPFSRFSRLEGSFQIANVQDDRLEIREPFDRVSGFPTQAPSLETVGLGSFSYLEPSIAYVYDNALYGWTGPFIGRRMRLEVGQNLNFIGAGWKFTSITADNRRYDKIIGPVTLATREMFFGRIGRDEQQFRFFGGNTELIRGYTAGSYSRNECLSANDPNSITGCSAFDQLVGTRAAVFNAELRFPLLSSAFGFLPRGFPTIEGAFFYDAGVFWETGQTVKLSRGPGDDIQSVRTPLQSYGFSARANLLNFLILRLDYARPIHRSGVQGLWTISLGPTF